MSRIKRTVGFGGRMFLDEAEWLTYCKRKPVRYIRTPKTAACQVCGLPGSVDNPLHNAHIIGFDVGVIELGMTPDFLDSEKNIVTAHCIRATNNRSWICRDKSAGWDLGVKECHSTSQSAFR